MNTLNAKETSTGWVLITLQGFSFTLQAFPSLGDAQDFAASLGYQALRYL